jgi:PQQ-dependent dehydrogenase (methanol/ethanol family)
LPRDGATFLHVSRLWPLAVLIAPIFSPLPLRSQDSAAAETRAQAEKIYSTRCAVCHGAQAHGGEYGPPLVGNRDLQDKSLAWIHDVIHHGIPSGGMPAFDLPDTQLNALASLVESFNQPAVKSSISGSTSSGEQYFFGAGQCSSCHMVNGRGSATGPDLSSVAGELTTQQMREALLEPSARFAPGYTPVTARLQNGQFLHGFVRSRSSFETVLQDPQGRFHLLSADEVRSLKEDSQSPMPATAATPEQLQDLLAYLTGVKPGVDAPHAISSVADETSLPGGIPFSRILHPLPGDWLSYNDGLAGNRYSNLDGINARNATHLQLQWIYTVPLWRQFYPDSSYYRENMQYFGLETTPLVADGIMYATGPQQAYALDARTGQPIWNYSRPRTPRVVGDASLASNRGLAILGDKLFMLMDDAHLIALNRTTGRPVWETVMPPDKPMHYGGTGAPLVVKDMVIAGVAGGDWGIRGFLAAYRASDGRLLWRRWTVPAKGDPEAETWGGDPPETGGGGTWTTGSYDPETDTIYWATGNPYPDGDDRHRPGDNLYTNSILALNPSDGALKWYYQVTPHDVHDWDTTAPLLLTDAIFQGKKRQLLLHADKNGFMYVLDRTNGHVLLAKPFVKVTWAAGIGPDGRPQRLPDNGVVCPSAGSNWNATAFNPETGLYYLIAVEKCNVSLSVSGASGKLTQKEPAQRYLVALDLEGKVRWKIPMAGPADGKRLGGILATAGGLLFYGEPSGDVVAADARNGKGLWHFRTTGENKASAMTYMVDGKQFVALAAGPNILSFSLP